MTVPARVDTGLLSSGEKPVTKDELAGDLKDINIPISQAPGAPGRAGQSEEGDLLLDISNSI